MSAVDMFWQAPPVSRTLALATVTLSVLVYTSVIPLYYLVYNSSFLFRLPPQVWRLVTSFLITGPKLGILLDTYFLYTYGSRLEKSSPKLSQPGDFVTYLVFVSAVILGLNTFVTGGMIFTSALVLAFAYTATQDDRGMQASFFVITIPAQWIPYAMLLMTLVADSPQAAMIQGTGLIAAHLHDFLTRLWPMFGGGWNVLQTPAFLSRRLFVREKRTGHGTAYAPRPAPAAEASSSRVLPESWSNRGSGHRLGGD